jgi:uncharacterized protein
MQYASGTQGRLFYIRFDHGEDLLSDLQIFIREHQIRSGMIHLIGALSQGNLVAGPKKTVLPPDPDWHSFDEARELVGIAMIREGSDGPVLHYHCSTGRGDSTLTGCIRSGTKVYIVIEAVITEFAGFTVFTEKNENIGLDLPIPRQNQE